MGSISVAGRDGVMLVRGDWQVVSLIYCWATRLIWGR